MASSSHPFADRAQPLTVVVADDVAEIRDLLKHWLRELGCEVICVSTGGDAARLLRTQRVDVVITDILMPDGDGLEVIAEARRVRSGARILAMSGGGNHLRAIDCLKFAKGLGAHGVLMKPFNREQVLEALKAAFSDESPRTL